MNQFDAMIASVSGGDVALVKYCREKLTLYDMSVIIEMRAVNA